MTSLSINKTICRSLIAVAPFAAGCGALTSQSETRAVVHYTGLQCGSFAIYKVECRNSQGSTGVINQGTYAQCETAQSTTVVKPVNNASDSTDCATKDAKMHFDSATKMLNLDGKDSVACKPLDKSTDYGATGITCSEWDYISSHPMI